MRSNYLQSVEKTNFLAKARVSIPKPPIREIPNYDNEVSHSFKRSNGFIKYIPLTVKEEENKVEYNLDRADEVRIYFFLSLLVLDKKT